MSTSYAGVNDSLSMILTRAADKSSRMVDLISSRILVDAAEPEECPSPCAGTAQAAVDAGTSPHVPEADVAHHHHSPAMSPSLMAPTGEQTSWAAQ